MADLTKLTTPFGLLDKETQDALRTHGGPYQIYDGVGWVGTVKPGGWLSNSTYRVKPSPVVETRTGEAWCRTYKTSCPSLWDHNCGVEGTYTLTLHDGKPVKLVWEAE